MIIPSGYLYSAIYWVLVMNYFVLVRYFDVVENGIYIYRLEVILYATVPGILIGLFFHWFESIRILSLKKNYSFGEMLIRKTVLYMSTFVILIFCTSLYGNSLEFALNFVSSASGILVFLHLFLASLLYHFIRLMNKNFGPGILYKYITGKYFIPKEEDRIFLFIDLKSSTQIAENLEHVEYSKLIQYCFNLLTEPLLDNGGDIYQYVGDETVVTWEVDNEESYQKCLDFYFDFIKKINEDAHIFQKKFGLSPQFKAGIASGNVTVAEVGDLKSEIAYHGDVLNTAARIEGLCNNYGHPVLFSEHFKNKLITYREYEFEFINEFQLKGKKHHVKVFGLKID